MTIEANTANGSNYRHQKDISANTAAALLSLIGNDWGQHGDIVFFLQGAFWNEDGKVHTFQYVTFFTIVAIILIQSL